MKNKNMNIIYQLCIVTIKCDVQNGRCNKGEASIQFFTKFAAKKVVKDVVCPGGQSDCPYQTTCCQLADGEFGW